MNKKKIMIFFELWGISTSIWLIIVFLYIFWTPMFLNPTPEGKVIIYTNYFNELYIEFILLFGCLIVSIIGLLYIMKYRGL